MCLSVGLTGGIAMGKSTTAAMFVELGAKLWDADAAVDKLYQEGAEGSQAIKQFLPEAIIDDVVDRDVLRKLVSSDSDLLARLEDALRPFLRQDRDKFRAENPNSVLIFDIPLLFENGIDSEMDVNVTVSIPAELQRNRAMSRPAMRLELFQRLIDRQWSDKQRCARADFIIDTQSLDRTRAQVSTLMGEFTKRLSVDKNA